MEVPALPLDFEGKYHDLAEKLRSANKGTTQLIIKAFDGVIIS